MDIFENPLYSQKYGEIININDIKIKANIEYGKLCMILFSNKIQRIRFITTYPSKKQWIDTYVTKSDAIKILNKLGWALSEEGNAQRK